MKTILKITCILILIYSIYFPISYFEKDIDKSEVRTSHIIVDTKEEIEKIKKELDTNPEAKFEDLAKEYSECPSSEYGGDIGYNARDAVDKTYSKVSFITPYDKISEPFKSEIGWHILKVTDIKYYSDKENFSRKYYIDTKNQREIMKELNKTECNCKDESKENLNK